MPKTRNEVIQLYREHFPELQKLSDNDVWRVVGLNDPEVATSVSELTQPPPDPNAEVKNLPSGLSGLIPQNLQQVFASAVPGLRYAQIANQPPSIMSEHAASALGGVAKLPAAVAESVKQAPALGNLPPGLQFLAGAINAASPFLPTARQGIELVSPGTVNAPTPESKEALGASSAAGTMLAASELPNVLSLAGPPLNAAGRLIQKGFINSPIVNRWMGINAKWVKHGANPGEQIIADNLLASTKEQTLKNINGALDIVGPRLDSKLAQATASGFNLDGEQILADAINKASKSARGSEASFQNSLLSVVDNAYRQFPDLKNLTAERAHQFKTWIGDSTKFEATPSVMDAQINDVLMNVYGDVNQAIKAGAPGIEADMRQWGNLYQAKQGLLSGIDKDVVGTGTGSMRKVVATRAAKLAAIPAGAATLTGSVYAIKKALD